MKICFFLSEHEQVLLEISCVYSSMAYYILTLNGQILILADESLEDSVVHSDSRSLATLLLIRDIQVATVAV